MKRLGENILELVPMLYDAVRTYCLSNMSCVVQQQYIIMVVIGWREQ